MNEWNKCDKTSTVQYPWGMTVPEELSEKSPPPEGWDSVGYAGYRNNEDRPLENHHHKRTGNNLIVMNFKRKKDRLF